MDGIEDEADLEIAIRANIQSARDCEKQQNWGEASQLYLLSIAQLEIASQQLSKGEAGLTPHEKMLAVACHTGLMHCQLSNEKRMVDAGMKVPISYRVIHAEIDKTLRSIERYDVKNQVLIWNWFYLYCNKCEENFREGNMANPAEAFFHWSHMAQMNYYRYLAVRKPRRFFPLRKSGQSFWAYLKARLLVWSNYMWEDGKSSFEPFTKYIYLKFDHIVTGFRVGIIRPLTILVVLPLILFAFGYSFTHGVVMGSKSDPITMVSLKNFAYLLSFSAYTFTGAGPGDITLKDSLFAHLLAAVEVGWGYTVTVIILSRLLNLFSSISSQSPKTDPPRFEDSD
jgi:hypothetical protein